MTRESTRESKDVLEQNVSTLLETGGEPPKLSDVARARIRAELVAKHGAVAVRSRRPLVWVALGLATTAAIALVATRFIGSGEVTVQDGEATTLADGTTYLAEPGAKISVLGRRRVRVEGAALLDVAPGQGTFVVETALGTIEVLGTRFLVDSEADRTTAAVVRGQVKLATDRGDVLLHAGEQGVAEAGHPPVRGPAPRLSHLVSWAREARHRDEHDVQPLHHGTLFARDPGVRSHPPWGAEYPLPIKHLGIDVVVEDQVARVALDQTFHNDADQTLEGVYRFAIPPDAALQRLAMYVDGKLVESGVVERMRARRIYEELVYRRVDPALLEWAGTGRLALRVYPLPARQDKRLMLAYTQSLPKLYDDWTLTVPLPEVDQPIGELEIAMRVKGCANCELSSTSHAIEVTRQGEDAIVHYKRGGDKLGDSFVLHVRDTRRQPTIAVAHAGDEHYVMVRAPADLGGAAPAYRPRTWVILDDVSASRGRLELRAQADLVDAFVRELDEEDRVAVVAFDVEARRKLAPTRVLDVDRVALRKSLADEGGVGATDFGAALDAATQALAGVAPADAMIVYLGDGVITSGARNLDALRAQLAGKAHFIGVGVGDGPDTQTLEGLAGATGGYATTIDLADDVGWRAFDLVAALHTARATGIEARLVDAAGAPVPATVYVRSPQLADGEELELVAKLAGAGAPAAVELTGTRDGAPWKQTVALAAASHEAGYLPRLWAQRHIAARLLAKHEPVVVPPCPTAVRSAVICHTEPELREARDEAIRQEVVALGKRYFLLSRHTSLLVLENDAMYAQYGVAKGTGDTWAPYAMPSTIPVVATPSPMTPANVASDAELVRSPMRVFYDQGGYGYLGGLDDGIALAQPAFRREGMLGGLGTIGHGAGGGGVGNGYGLGDSAGATRGSLDLQANAHVSPSATDPFTVATVTEAKKAEEPAPSADEKSLDRDANKQQRISTDELGGMATTKDLGWGSDKSGKALWYGIGPIVAARYTYPTDVAFDDVTNLVPALVSDAEDTWRERLAAAKGTHTIDAAARALLAEARRRLPSGTYRWGERELAIDDVRRFGWRRTTDGGLAETASFDGATFTRRYGELALDVTRTVGDDDVALAFAYLPVWIAEPAHYARWFDVKARGAHEVALSTQVRGKDRIAFVLQFDDQARLVAIIDAAGAKLVEVMWDGHGPVAARVAGEAVSVGFTGQVIADAPAWAHQGVAPGVVVELPMHLAAYWDDRIAKQTPGTPAWRHAQRQRMASAAATQDRNSLWRVYEELRAHGGVELGDLALASGGFAAAPTDEAYTKAIASFTATPLARYLTAARAYSKSSRAGTLAPQLHDGFVGALWELRAITAQLAAGEPKPAAEALAAMTGRAPLLRMVAAAAAANHYELPAEAIARAWDAVAIGSYVNVARVQAALALFNRGAYDAGAERIAKLVAELDLHALPPRLEIGPNVFQSSRRGAAGWQIVWTTWRDRVLAGDSYAHVMALLALGNYHPADLQAILARAATLAGDDVDRKVTLARTAVALGQGAWAQMLIQPILAASPSRELYQLVASMALAQGKTGEALADLEAAQDAGADEVVGLDVVRGELGQIIGVARQLAVQSTGAERERAIRRALAWGTRWRAVDEGNPAIDEQLGELLLAVGDAAGAWRQLSSTIERDPWSGEGYMTVADAFERQGKVEAALPFWQQAIVIDQTNPTPRLRKAQALIALGRGSEGDAQLKEITGQHWHDVWSNVVYQAQDLLTRGKQAR